MATNQIPWSEQDLLNWINNEGYPLEYRVAQKFAEQKYEPVMDLHVASTESSNAREIDVCVDHNVQSYKKKVRLLIECKYTSSPWLLMSGFGQAAGILEIDYFPWSGDAPFLSHEILRDKSIEKKIIDDGYFGDILYPSNSIVEPKKNNNQKDTSYTTLMKIAGASRDYISLVAKNHSAVQMMCIPCIVIQNDLFNCKWNYAIQKFELTPAKLGRIYWMGDGFRNCIIVGTEKHLNTFVNQTIQMATSIGEIWKNKL